MRDAHRHLLSRIPKTSSVERSSAISVRASASRYGDLKSRMMHYVVCFTYNATRAILNFVIRSFRDRDTRAIFNRERMRKFESAASMAHRTLHEIHRAARLSDLAALPSFIGMWEAH
jgi:hypothetical protein